MDDNETSDLILYVKNQSSQSYSEKSFNTADGLVLAELGYIHWDELGIDYLYYLYIHPCHSNSSKRKALAVKHLIDNH